MSENDYNTPNTYVGVVCLGLTFYVRYLVVLEVRSVDCSYKEGKSLP